MFNAGCFARTAPHRRRGSRLGSDHAGVAVVLVLGAFVLAALLPPRAAHAQTVQYAITDLGTLGGSDSSAYDINNAGRIIGFSALASGDFRHFVYADGVMTALPETCTVTTQNNQERMAGFSSPAEGGGGRAAFFSATGAPTDIGLLQGGRFSGADAINDFDVVVGESDTVANPFAFPKTHAFLYANGVINDIGTLTGSDGASHAYDINNAGQTVGESTAPQDAIHGFLYQNGAMRDLGSLMGSGGGSVARALNEAGQVVGDSTIASGGNHAFLYANGVMKDLGTLPDRDSLALDINNGGQVVGYAYTATGDYHAFIYRANYGLQDLNNLISPLSGWKLQQATAINDAGQIVGYGMVGTHTHAFLLTPTAPAWKPVDVAVNRTDNTSRLLWRDLAGRCAVWSLSPSGTAQIKQTFGPIAGATCEQVAVAPNGQTTLLWKNATARKADVWTLAANLSSVVKKTAFNYPPGYTPSFIAADASSNLRLTWRKNTGAVAFWTITPATGAITGSAVYGPYAGLQDGPIAVGPDGRIRFVWKNTQTGGATLWTIPAAYGAPSAGYTYRVLGAEPVHIAVGADNKARLQWAYGNGKIALWKINTAAGGNGAIESGKLYGPISDVSPLGLSVGGDNQTRQLWAYTNGKAALWVLSDPLTAITAAYTYGPLP